MLGKDKDDKKVKKQEKEERKRKEEEERRLKKEKEKRDKEEKKKLKKEGTSGGTAATLEVKRTTSPTPEPYPPADLPKETSPRERVQPLAPQSEKTPPTPQQEKKLTDNNIPPTERSPPQTEEPTPPAQKRDNNAFDFWLQRDKKAPAGSPAALRREEEPSLAVCGVPSAGNLLMPATPPPRAKSPVREGPVTSSVRPSTPSKPSTPSTSSKPPPSSSNQASQHVNRKELVRHLQTHLGKCVATMQRTISVCTSLLQHQSSVNEVRK